MLTPELVSRFQGIIPLKGSKFPRVKSSSTNCLVTKALQLVLDYCKAPTCGTSYPRTNGNFQSRALSLLTLGKGVLY
jgi:hypothetical protein